MTRWAANEGGGRRRAAVLGLALGVAAAGAGGCSGGGGGTGSTPDPSPDPSPDPALGSALGSAPGSTLEPATPPAAADPAIAAEPDTAAPPRLSDAADGGGPTRTVVHAATGAGTLVTGEPLLTLPIPLPLPLLPRTMPIGSAVADVYRSTGLDGHFNVDLYLHDGETVVIGGAGGVDWSVDDPFVVFVAELYSPGTGAFAGGTFAHAASADPNDPALSGAHFFLDAAIGIDADGDGEFGPGELREVVGGQIVWSGAPPALSIEVTVELADGAPLTGTYAGNVVSID